MIFLSLLLACGEADADKDSSAEPATEPSGEPTSEASSEPAGEPASEPASEASSEPASEPAGEPAEEPSSEPTPADDIAEGDLVITEIMKNPCVCTPAGTCPPDETATGECVLDDAMGEWFEIYNASGSELNLMGLRIKDGNADSPDAFQVSSELMIAADSYLLFGNNEESATNGGVTVDYVFNGDSFSLANGDDEIILSNGNGVIDGVSYTDGEFPDLKGASLTLSSDGMDSTSNDDGANWCEGSSVYGDGDQGTPGAVNDPCP